MSMGACSAGLVLFALMGPVTAQEADLVSGEATEVVVSGGEEPSAALFNYTVDRTGAVFISAWSEVVDPRLRIVGAGEKLLGENSDGGGATTAFLRLNVTAGNDLTIYVASENGTGEGAVTVFLRELPAPSEEARGRLEEARAILAEAQRLKGQGNYDDARAEVSIALDVLLSESDDPLSEEAAMFVEQLALFAFNPLQDVSQAYRAFAAALEWSRAHNPPTHDAQHTCMQNVAAMLMKLGRADEAYPVAVEAWQGKARNLGADHVDTLFARTNVAGTLHSLRRMVESEEHFAEIYESYSKNLDPNDGRLAMAARNLGSLRFELGDMRGAYELTRRAHEFMERTLPEENPERQAVRSNLARILSALGDREGALVLQEDVYKVFQRTLPPESLDLQRIRQNLALSRRHAGDHLGALELEEQVFEARKRLLPAGHRDVLSARSNMAITRLALGDDLGAHAIFHDLFMARSSLEPGDPDRLSSMENLSVSLHTLERHEEAFELERRVLAQRKLMNVENSSDVLRAKLNLASTLSKLGRHAEALELGEEVYTIRLKELPNDDPDLQHTRGLFAMIRFNAGNVDGAIELEEEVYAILSRTLPMEAPRLMIAQLNLAVKIGGYRDRARGRALIVEALRGSRRRMSLLSTTFGLRGLEEANREVARLLHVLLSTRGPDAIDTDSDREDLEWIVAFRGLADRRARVFEWMRRERTLHSGLDTALVDARDARSTYLRALEAPGGSPDEASALRARMEAAEEALVRSAGEILEPESITPDAMLSGLLQRIPPNGAVILTKEFSKLAMRGGAGEPVPVHEESAPTVALFVARPTGAVRRFDLSDSDGLGAVCREIRGAFTSGGVDLEIPDGALMRALEPALNSLPAATDTLYICTEGALASIPWAALELDDGTYLGDRFRIRYLENLTALAPRPANEGQPSALVLGGADYDGKQRKITSDRIVHRGPRRGASNAAWTPLPASAREAEAIQAVFERNHGDGSSVLLAGKDASRASFVEAVRGKRFVHLATHASVAPEVQWDQARRAQPSIGDLVPAPLPSGMDRGLLSEIVFAGANRKEIGRQALLSAFELASLDLSTCELAVLSACETNVGPRLAGDAATGMNRALQLAGARNTITSLWKVRDDSARAFFDAFYAALWDDGMEIDDAFDSARRTLIARRLGPEAWAGFVLYVSAP